MAAALWVLIILAFLPYVFALSAMGPRKSQEGFVDLNQPRVQAAKLTGFGARLVGTQYNAWEALSVYAASVFAAFAAGADLHALDTYAWVFLGARLVHAAAYLADYPMVRISALGLGFFACINFIEAAINAAA